MIRLKHTLLTLIAATGFALLPAVPALAADAFGICKDPRAAQSDSCKAQSGNTGQNPITGPNGLLTKATQVVAIISGIASVIMVIIGGFRFVTSGGDSGGVASARKTVLYAVIGAAVTVLSQSIVQFVLKRI